MYQISVKGLHAAAAGFPGTLGGATLGAASVMRGIEGRRSPRVLLRIGVLVEDPPPMCPARTAVVNRHGALLLSPRAYDLGSSLLLRNLESGLRIASRVVWDGGTDDSGSHKLGVEFAEERPDYWGPEYDKAVLAEEAAG